jgi:hypothetical protein
MVACSCGRSLRAKVEQIGTEVRCWDCHKMVLVLDPNQGQRVARELSDGALVVIKGPGLNSVLVGASLVTGLLAIPYVGVWCSAIALTLGASAYGEIMRQVSRGPTDEPEPGLRERLLPGSIPKFVACSLMAFGTVVPLWWLNAGLHQSPHWDWIGRGIAALAWFAGPVLMLMLYARTDQDAPLGFRRSLKLLVRHPIATALALAVVPFTLVLAEVCIGLIVFCAGNLPFFALDYMPMPLLAPTNEEALMYAGIAYYHMLDYRTYPVSMFYRGYFDGLRHGYSFAGAIPASLSMTTRAEMDAQEGIGLMWPFYDVVRLLFVVGIVTSLLAAFAIQARWLGSIPALERKRPA